MNRITRFLYVSSSILLLAIMFSSCDDAGVLIPPVTSAGRFTSTYGAAGSDVLTSMKPTSDGGFIMGGYTISSGAGLNDFYLVKTDVNGTVSWSKTYGGNLNDVCTSVAPTSDGGFIAAGFTNSFGADGVDAMLVKTDASGNVTWTKVYKIAHDQYITSVIQDSDNDFVLCGYSDQDVTNNNDVFVMKVTPGGVYQWEYLYGDVQNDFGVKIIKTSDGGFLIAGSTFNFGGAGDAYLIKLNPDGTYNWSKTYGGTSIDEAVDVIETAGFDFMVVGDTRSFGLPDGDMLLFKTDHSGSVYNDTSNGMPRTIGNTLGSDIASSVSQASDGSYFITGFISTSPTTTDILVAHYFGNLVYDYSKTYGSGSGTDKGFSVISNGTSLTIGATVNSIGSGDNDFMLMNMKADSTGRFVSCLTDNGISPNGGNPPLIGTSASTVAFAPTIPVMVDVAVTVGAPGTSATSKCTQ